MGPFEGLATRCPLGAAGGRVRGRHVGLAWRGNVHRSERGARQNEANNAHIDMCRRTHGKHASCARRECAKLELGKLREATPHGGEQLPCMDINYGPCFQSGPAQGHGFKSR